MFSFKVSDVQGFEDRINAVACLIDEATFNIAPEGISLCAVNPSRVAVIDLEWPKSVFEEYACDEPQKLCLDLTKFIKVIRCATKDDTITIRLNEKLSGLEILIEGKYRRTFNMPVLEPSKEEAPKLKVTFTAQAHLVVDDLVNLFEGAALVSDYVKIIADMDHVEFVAKGDLMSNNAELKQSSESTALLDLDVKESAKAAFSLAYLVNIVGAASEVSDLAKLELASDMPLRLDFQQKNDGKLVYWLAPRIEVE